MGTEKFYSPLKIGLFLVVLSYFLFALHDTFTLSWFGEWNRIYPGHFLFEVFAEDLIGFVGTISRFIAGIVAFTVIIYYFAKKDILKPAAFNAVRLILILEGIYWALAFLPTAYFAVKAMFFTNMYSHYSLSAFLNLFATGTLPVLVESIATPIMLFVFVYKLNPGKPLKAALRWGMITGTFYVFLFWLLNTTIWVSVIDEKGKGWGFLTSNPQYLLSFVLTAFGLLLLGFYAAGFTLKSRRIKTMQELNLKKVGVIVLALGLYFLWNYLTWIFFGGWNDWYAWFLGHNEDLWALSLPLLGLPLMFSRKPQEKDGST